MTDILSLIFYIIFLFLLAIGNAVVIYHILRFRDAGDISGLVLIVYLAAVGIILFGTALLINWPNLINS